MTTSDTMTIQITSATGTRPWFVEIRPGATDWPPLRFPFQMSRPGTDAGEKIVRQAARRALKAARSYYAADPAAPFAADVWLLDSRGSVVCEVAP